MIKENRTSKYLLYAIGEIILVVIGILIALQINTWNLEQIDRRNEKNILKDLRVEFQENFKDAQRVYAGNMGIVLAMGKIQEITNTKQYTSRQLDSLLYYAFDWFDYTPKPGASNNLINSGNLNLISNADLRKLLTLWSGVDAELDDDEKLAVQFSQDVLIPFLTQNYPISNLEYFDMQVDFYSANNDSLILPYKAAEIAYDAEGLLSNRTFQSLISAKKIYALHNAAESTIVVKTCSSILNLIEKELKK